MPQGTLHIARLRQSLTRYISMDCVAKLDVYICSSYSYSIATLKTDTEQIHNRRQICHYLNKEFIRPFMTPVDMIFPQGLFST
jgi:hypothetical protein